MDADEVQAVAEAADGDFNILGALSSITGLQSPAPPRRASDASEGDNSAADGAANPSPSAPPAPGSSAGNSPSSGTGRPGVRLWVPGSLACQRGAWGAGGLRK